MDDLFIFFLTAGLLIGPFARPSCL
jgi:hypothetical protein